MLFLKQGSHMRRTILIAVLIIVACIFCFLFPIFHSSAAPNYRKSIIPNEFIIYVGSEDSQTEYTVESGGVVSVMVNEEPLVIILPYELSMTDHWWPEKSNKVLVLSSSLFKGSSQFTGTEGGSPWMQKIVISTEGLDGIITLYTIGHLGNRIEIKLEIQPLLKNNP